MRTIYISLDAAAIRRRMAGIAGLKSAIKEMAEEAGQIAVDTIKATIPSVGIRNRTGNLLDSIAYDLIGTDTAEVFVDEKKAPYAGALNFGYSPFQMKPGLLNAKNTKISKSGNRYTRIPMPGGMRTVSEALRMTKSGQVAKRQPMWAHPGYSGRLFWELGMNRARYQIITMVNEKLTELLPEEE